ncbi:tumor necrosis factor b (TNF superfamily, member 2) [Pelmatolapia mariae]|uniref:tumor necrosis factor b (TNF superfamily, member 2) n=1 Tax=Pelmatolapia mariae TaxID=158779 RepID=UPI002FE5ED58
MVAYTTTPVDVEAGPEAKTVVLVEKKSPAEWIWKVCAVLVVVALCLAGVLLFAWYWNTRPERMTQLGQPEALKAKNTGDKTEPHSTLKRISSKAKAAIHLEGSDSKGQLEWRNGQGQAFAQGGFKLEANKIIIPHTGLYFVYSQASFRVICGNSDDNEDEEKSLTILSHRISRYSESMGSPSTLMSALRSACQDTIQDSFSDHGWYNAIYLGAVFQLNEGDTLWTETNQLSELETDEGRTFFGVFAL